MISKAACEYFFICRSVQFRTGSRKKIFHELPDYHGFFVLILQFVGSNYHYVQSIEEIAHR